MNEMERVVGEDVEEEDMGERDDDNDDVEERSDDGDGEEDRERSRGDLGNEEEGQGSALQAEGSLQSATPDMEPEPKMKPRQIDVTQSLDGRRRVSERVCSPDVLHNYKVLTYKGQTQNPQLFCKLW